MADRAALIAHWTNVARELVDTPANLMTPIELSDRVGKFAHLGSETIYPGGEVGLGALAAVGGSSAIPAAPDRPSAHRDGAPETPRLALVGKAVTFDTGGYFLKPQSDIVRQKADMAGGAAVIAALGAIAELELPLSVTGSCPPARTC